MPPTIDELLGVAEETDEFLEDMRTLHRRRVRNAISKTQKRIIASTRDLETDSSGRLVAKRVNLKLAEKVQRDAVGIFNAEYGTTISDLVGDFDEISGFIQNSWSDLGETVNFTGIDKDIIDSLKDNALADYEQFGLQAQRRVANTMYDQIIGGAPYSDLLTTFEGIFEGHTDVRGVPMAVHAQTHAFDSIMNFHNQVNLKKADDLGINHYLYMGDIIKTSRRFCRVRAGKLYSRAQIDSWNRLEWQGKRGPAFEFRGGWNCRHHWQPTRPEWVEGKETEVQDFFKEEAEGGGKVPPKTTKKKAKRAPTKRKAAPRRGTQAAPTTTQAPGLSQRAEKNIRKIAATTEERLIRKDINAGRISEAEARKRFAAVDRGFKIRNGRPRLLVTKADLQAAAKTKVVPKRKVVTKKKPKPKPKVKRKVAPKKKAPAKRKAAVPKAPSKTATTRAEEALRAADDELREIINERKIYKSWKVAGNSYNAHPSQLSRQAYEAHQKVFEARMNWYKTLPRVKQLEERSFVLDTILNKGSIRVNEVTAKARLVAGTNHMSYRLLSELERSDVGLLWRKTAGRANWSSRFGNVELFAGNSSEVVAHEFAHAIDAMMGNGARGSWGETGFVWKNEGRYVGAKERKKVRSLFKQETNGQIGKYTNGDGNYYKGNWIKDYEGRIYEGPKQQIGSFTLKAADVEELLDTIGEQFFAMNSQRYNAAVKKATNAFTQRLQDVEQRIERAKLFRGKSFTRARERYEAQRSSLLSQTREGFVEDAVATDASWIKVKRQYPDMADFIEDFYRNITAT